MAAWCRAIIFDFDGTMLDTESQSHRSWAELYEEYGHPFPVDRWAQSLGSLRRDFDPCAHLARLAGIDDLVALKARRDRRKVELVNALSLMPGVEAIMADARALDMGLAIASSSDRTHVHGHLDRLGILERFDTVLSASDVARVKPAPDLYLAALDRLGVRPSEALVFEDSINGALAAQAAGVPCVVVPNPFLAALDFECARLRLPSLDAHPLEEILRTIVPAE